MSKSDTPRVNALLQKFSLGAIPPLESRYVAMADFARQLEVELSARQQGCACNTDAQRYRWLRDEAINANGAGPWCVIWNGAHPQDNEYHPCDGIELQKAIDAELDAIPAAPRSEKP